MSRTKLPMLPGAVLVFLLGVAPGPVWAQRPPIKIGFMTDLTGTAAQAAKDMVNGLTMYLVATATPSRTPTSGRSSATRKASRRTP